MFSLVPSASKLALMHLARKMKEEGGKLIDCQFETPHLLTMGGRHITYEQYMVLMTNCGSPTLTKGSLTDSWLYMATSHPRGYCLLILTVIFRGTPTVLLLVLSSGTVRLTGSSSSPMRYTSATPCAR